MASSEPTRSESAPNVEICRDCGKPATAGLGSDTYWFADNELWNAVNGSPNGFLCPACFTAEAHDLGYVIGWRAGIAGEIEP